MKSLITLLKYLSIIAFSLSSFADERKILINGNIIGIEDKEAVVISENKIIFTGSNEDAMKMRNVKNDQVINLKGKTILPGIHDAHSHFESGIKEMYSSLNFRGLNLREIKAMIKDTVAKAKPGQIIRARGFNQAFFKDKKWPTKRDLDKVAPNNPVIVERIDGHAYWVNSKTLERLKINKNTKSPHGGVITKDSKGVPTGIFKENAMGLITKIKGDNFSLTASKTLEELINDGMAYAHSQGITSLTTSGSIDLYNTLIRMEKAGKVNLRFNVWFPYDKFEELKKLNIKTNQGNGFVRVSFLKLFLDGTIGSATASFFHPYEDKKYGTGKLMFSNEELFKMVEKAHLSGYQIGAHAIGSKAVRQFLDIVEKVQKKHGKRNLRHRVEHTQFVTDQDIQRFKALDVIASMQPTHCTTDLLVVEDRIGSQRANQGYRWNSLNKVNAPIAFGSDWPVEPLDPRRGLYSSVQRKNIEKEIPKMGWFKHEEISLAQAVKFFTYGSAYASNSETKTGLIQKGQFADFTIYDGDLEDFAKNNPKKILNTPLFMTIVNGEITYQQKNNTL